MYICIYVLPIAYCLLSITYCSGGCVAAGHGCSHAPAPPGSAHPGLGPEQFMKHGHEMLWFLRGSFSESELPLSYNAKVTNARTQLIGYEINLLSKV